jgi:hypothetical protein
MSQFGRKKSVVSLILFLLHQSISRLVYRCEKDTGLAGLHQHQTKQVRLLFNQAIVFSSQISSRSRKIIAKMSTILLKTVCLDPDPTSPKSSIGPPGSGPHHWLKLLGDNSQDLRFWICLLLSVI